MTNFKLILVFVWFFMSMCKDSEWNSEKEPNISPVDDPYLSDKLLTTNMQTNMPLRNELKPVDHTKDGDVLTIELHRRNIQEEDGGSGRNYYVEFVLTIVFGSFILILLLFSNLVGCCICIPLSFSILKNDGNLSGVEKYYEDSCRGSISPTIFNGYACCNVTLFMFCFFVVLLMTFLFGFELVPYSITLLVISFVEGMALIIALIVECTFVFLRRKSVRSNSDLWSRLMGRNGKETKFIFDEYLECNETMENMISFVTIEILFLLLVNEEEEEADETSAKGTLAYLFWIQLIFLVFKLLFYLFSLDNLVFRSIRLWIDFLNSIKQKHRYEEVKKKKKKTKNKKRGKFRGLKFSRIGETKKKNRGGGEKLKKGYGKCTFLLLSIYENFILGFLWNKVLKWPLGLYFYSYRLILEFCGGIGEKLHLLLIVLDILLYLILLGLHVSMIVMSVVAISRSENDDYVTILRVVNILFFCYGIVCAIEDGLMIFRAEYVKGVLENILNVKNIVVSLTVFLLVCFELIEENRVSAIFKLVVYVIFCVVCLIVDVASVEIRVFRTPIVSCCWFGGAAGVLYLYDRFRKKSWKCLRGEDFVDMFIGVQNRKEMGKERKKVVENLKGVPVVHGACVNFNKIQDRIDTLFERILM